MNFINVIPVEEVGIKPTSNANYVGVVYSNVLNTSLSYYLPLKGGSLSGNLDIGNSINNSNILNVNSFITVFSNITVCSNVITSNINSINQNNSGLINTSNIISGDIILQNTLIQTNKQLVRLKGLISLESNISFNLNSDYLSPPIANASLMGGTGSRIIFKNAKNISTYPDAIGVDSDTLWMSSSNIHIYINGENKVNINSNGVLTTSNQINQINPNVNNFYMGKVGIGTTNPLNYNLNVNGSINATSITINGSSISDSISDVITNNSNFTSNTGLNTSNYATNISNVLKANIDTNLANNLNFTSSTGLNTSNYATNISNVLKANIDTNLANNLNFTSSTGLNTSNYATNISNVLKANIDTNLANNLNFTSSTGLNTSNYTTNISNVLKANIDTNLANNLNFTSSTGLNTSNYATNISNVLKANIDTNLANNSNFTSSTGLNTSNYATNISNVLKANIDTNLANNSNFTSSTGLNTSNYATNISNVLKANIDTNLANNSNFTSSTGLNTSNYATNISNVLKANIDTNLANNSNFTSSTGLNTSNYATNISNVLQTNINTTNNNLTNYLLKTNDTISGTLSFGTRFQNNLIYLYGTQYGFGVNTNVLLYNASSSGDHKFYSGTTNTATISSIGIITATSFSGSGSDITGINYNNISLNKPDLTLYNTWTKSGDDIYNTSLLTGKVGIGTTNPLNYDLNVNGSINSTSLYQNELLINFDSYVTKSLLIDYGKIKKYPPKLYDSFTTDLAQSQNNEIMNILPTTYYKGTFTINNYTDGYGIGTYTIYTSSMYGPTNKALLFNNITINEASASAIPAWGQNYTGGIFNSSVDYYIQDSSYKGDWFILKLPQAIILTRFKFYKRTEQLSRSPGLWKCWGSNDGIAFTEIVEASNTITIASYSGYVYEKKLLFNYTAYSYIGFTINKLSGPDNMLNFNEVELYSEPLFISSSGGTMYGQLNISTITGNDGLLIYTSNNLSSNNIIFKNNSNYTGSIGFGGTGLTGTYSNNLFIQSSTSLVLNANGKTMASIPDLFINNAGNIGINTNNPGGYKLNVNGSLLATNIISSLVNSALPSTGVSGGSGDRLILNQGGPSVYPFSFGIYNGALWYSVPTNGSNIWYIGGQSKMSLSTLGELTATKFTGNVIGDLQGNVTGNVTGSLQGNVTGNVTGSLQGNASSATYATSAGTASSATNANNADRATYADTAGTATNASYLTGGEKIITGNLIVNNGNLSVNSGNLSVIGTINLDLLGISKDGLDMLCADDTSTGQTKNQVIRIKNGSFTEFHRCFTNDELFNRDNPQLFKDIYMGRIVITSGIIQNHESFKDAENNIIWAILTGKASIKIEDAIPMVKLSRKKKDKKVIGVLGLNTRKNTHPERLIVNSLGEGGIWVCNSNGNIENGDYITSSDYLGYGEKQDEIFLCNYTVGKATIDCNFELDSPLYNCFEIDDLDINNNKLRVAFIGCIYHCG